MGFPCYTLAAAAVPSSAAVDTPCYSAAFVHKQEVAVAAAVAVAGDQGGSLHLEERTVAAAAAVVDTGRAEDSWMADLHCCSPWAAAVGVVAAAGAILGTTVEAVYEYRRLDSGDDSKKNVVAGIDFLRIRVG